MGSSLIVFGQEQTIVAAYHIAKKFQNMCTVEFLYTHM